MSTPPSPKWYRHRNIPIPKGVLERDPHLEFLRNPHATLILIFGILFLTYWAFRDSSALLSPALQDSTLLHTSESQQQITDQQRIEELESLINTNSTYYQMTHTTRGNYRTGVLAGCVCFLLFCMAQLKDGVFVRPHPAVWRIVTGCGVLYLCGLVFLLFQTQKDAREFLRLHLDPTLGVPLPERSYAEDCRVYTPEEPIALFGFELPFKNIIAALDDRFVWAHFIGWWGKTVLFRDVYICWFSSILFEIMELSLQHLLPNFAECWWDHIVLDVFGANLIGIVLGGLTIRFFEMSSYDWTDSGWSKRAPQQKLPALNQLLSWFTPRFDELHWEWLDTWQRFAGLLLLLFLNQGSELTAFFLKYILWVPAEHDLNIVRLLIWWLMAAPATRELYLFATDPTVRRIGANLWLVIACLAVEIMICVKFGSNMFDDAVAPPLLKTAWLIVIAAVGGWCLFKLNQNMRRTKNEKIANKSK